MNESNIHSAREALIHARELIQANNLRAALLHMKWACERLLPEGQQYCTQLLHDDDPDKTLQGFLDNIVEALRHSRHSAPSAALCAPPAPSV